MNDKSLVDQLQRIIERDVCQQMTYAATFFDYGYSGRGMMGRKCVAISGSHAQCQRTIAQIIFVMHEQVLEEVLSMQDGMDQMQRQSELGTQLYNAIIALMQHKIDNLGLDYVYYFPQIPFVEEIDMEGD